MLQKFEKHELESKTVDELRKICKEAGISYYENGKRIKKAEIIERLTASSEKDSSDEVSGTEQVQELTEEERMERKKKYIEEATIGTIVAFKLPSGKVISAMITKKSTKGRKFMVETKYGAEFKIAFDDVLWVRTNKRWPKGVYQLFKKNDGKVVSENGEEV